MAGFDWESVRQIRHFSHPHILELNTQVDGGRASGDQYCRGCIKSVANGLVYSCKLCNNFFLHLSCSQIPMQITHPADNHVLNLLSQPRFCGVGRICICDACGQEMGQGFSFHCSSSELDLHPSCANLPMKLDHQLHPQHTLALSFSPPYPDKAFKCDVCNKCSQNSWHYHCSECFFDVHVTCTQISSLRERLMNQFLENQTQGLSGGHIPKRECPLFKGHGYMGRSYSEPHPRFNSPFARPSMFTNSSSFQAHQQQQQPPLPSAYGNRMHNTFAQQAMEAIIQNALGSTSTNSNFMNIMGSGIPGGDGSAILGNFSSSNCNFMNMLGSGIPGGDVSGILGNLNSLGDLSGIIGSMFGFGFF